MPLASPHGLSAVKKDRGAAEYQRGNSRGEGPGTGSG